MSFAGFYISRAALHTGKAGKAFPEDLDCTSDSTIVTEYIGDKLMGFDIHFVEGRTGCGALATLHTL